MPLIARVFPMTTPLRLELNLTSDTSHLADTRRTVERFATSCGFDGDATDQIGLCVNEAIANVIRHAYDGTPGRPIHLSAEATGEPDWPSIRIVLRDWGNGKCPVWKPAKCPEALEPGGVGMICLKQWMDTVDYAPQPDGMRLTLTKRRTPGAR